MSKNIVFKFTSLNHKYKNYSFIALLERILDVTLSFIVFLFFSRIKECCIYNFDNIIVIVDGTRENESIFDRLCILIIESFSDKLIRR